MQLASYFFSPVLPFPTYLLSSSTCSHSPFCSILPRERKRKIEPAVELMFQEFNNGHFLQFVHVAGLVLQAVNFLRLLTLMSQNRRLSLARQGDKSLLDPA